MSSSASDEDKEEEESTDTPTNTDDEDDDKSRLVSEYQVASTAYLVTVSFMILRHGIFNIDVLYSATGPFMGAAMAYILKDAAENDRLDSDTYKRLNTLALEYAALCSSIVAALVVRAIVAGKFPTFSYALFGIANGLAILPSFKRWKSAVDIVEEDTSSEDENTKLKFLEPLKPAIKKAKPYFLQLKDGTTNVAESLFKVKNANALVYLVGTVFFGLIKLFKLLEVLIMMSRRASTVAIGARVARFAKLSVLTGIMYTLKDAANRKRLEGTTFIELNFVASAVFASMAAYWYEGLLTTEVYIASFFSTFTGAKGLSSILKKRNKAKTEEAS